MSEVRTTAGVLRGRREAGVVVFRGIPFAEAPIGALRFAAPRPVCGWDGALEAVSYGFHPLLCFLDATGEALAGPLRPGNAGSNTAADHVTVSITRCSRFPSSIVTA